MFKNILFSSLVVLALAGVFGGAASATTTLETVRVTATTSDNFIVFIPTEFIPAARLKRSFASIGEADYETKLSRSQICQLLKKHPPQNCTTSTYPASPGIPSASGARWSGNGCGAGPMSTALASFVLKHAYSGMYSGDLNKPVKGNPSIDFTSVCNLHDSLYTSIATKSYADSKFGQGLVAICGAAPVNRNECLAFKNLYVSAVEKFGNSAYTDDQQQLACSVWGDSMKRSGCAS